uniref:NADH dehydrogenase subunit 6 n=1 Tax=Chrysopetalum debile TaxID=115833 RepID=UPI001EE11609|nr:NADH dehydrogenase subunit 6 [Chrysopetalum debile]UJV31482.1 NADH dehydrogenase subunit 6 [Chrysopetalum debile]
MSLFIICSLTVLVASSLMLMLAPVSLGFWILTLALLISITISASSYSWFALVVFLIYIGGMLVMFAYFAALQPNQQMTLKWAPLVAPLALIVLTKMDMGSMMFFLSATPKITYMFQIMNIPMLILLASILFVTLVAVVKIAVNLKSPLRPFM